MKNIKAAFFDIDNTLFDHVHDKWIESSLEAIKTLQKQGVKVFLCSARSFASVKLFGAYDLGIKWDGGIFSAGSTNLIGHEVSYTEKIPPCDVKRFLSLLHAHGYMAEVVGTKNTVYSKKKNCYVDAFIKDYVGPYNHARKYDNKVVTCFLAFAPEEIDDLIRKNFPNVYMFRFHSLGLDVKWSEHHKGDGVERMLKHFGFSKDEAIAFGDDIQDISMGEKVSTFVAVGNGKEEVKKAADFVCEPIWDDGISKFLKEKKII